ncbi:hypothetical protein M0R04_05700 [Candidatus Dojkabacteria bacterium]|jgi:hypothetical protein|nr:hypothetical protein [Candidatus Dojkabacteria bacterium]
MATEEWLKNICVKEYKELKAKEMSDFIIAYGELSEQFHGYLEGYPSNIKIFSGAVTKEAMNSIQKECPNTFTSNSNMGVWASIERPYLSLDGMLAIANNEHAKDNNKFDIKMEIEQVGGIYVIKAKIDSTLHGVKEGIAHVEIKKTLSREEKKNIEQSGNTGTENLDFEKAASTAVRKALNYMGYGRFPTRKTPYGEHRLIAEFRKFISDKKVKD